MSEATAYLGLGTNLGERWANLEGALRLLANGRGCGRCAVRRFTKLSLGE